MGFRGVTFDKELKKSMDDAMIYDTFLNHANGSLKGCEVTKVSNHVHISPGYFILAGRLINIYRTEMLSPEQGLEKKYTRLVFTVNLSKHNTETNFNQGYFEFLSSSETYPEPVQEDLFDDGKIYQLPICKFEISEEYGITNFVSELVLLDIGTITGQIEAIETIINDIENGKYATVEELENVEKEVQELDKDLEETNTKVTDVEKELAEEVSKLEKELEEANKRIINKNLLINANFKVSELINQRENKLYSVKNEYTIDQWQFNGHDTTSTLDLSGEFLTINTSKDVGLEKANCYIRQRIENTSAYIGRTCTLSVALKTDTPTPNGLIGTAIGIGTDSNEWPKTLDVKLDGTKQIISFTFKVNSGVHSVFINSEIPQKLEIYGAKLEYGDKSTLYFEEYEKKDQNGDIIKDKALCGLEDDEPTTKLMKCQRYLQVTTVPQIPLVADYEQLVIPTGVTTRMRITNPKATLKTILRVHDCKDTTKDATLFNVGHVFATNEYGTLIWDDKNNITGSGHGYVGGNYYTVNASEYSNNRVSAYTKLLVSAEI